jgi:hypothetical protein
VNNLKELLTSLDRDSNNNIHGSNPGDDAIFVLACRLETVPPIRQDGLPERLVNTIYASHLIKAELHPVDASCATHP